MKYVMNIMFLLQVLPCIAQEDKHPIDIQNHACIEQAVPTTIGSINCEKEALQAWEAELETVIALLKADPKLLDIELLEETQVNWRTFHEKQIQFYYSYYQIQYQGGTMARAATLTFEKRHLRERVLYLKELYEEIGTK